MKHLTFIYYGHHLRQLIYNQFPFKVRLREKEQKVLSREFYGHFSNFLDDNKNSFCNDVSSYKCQIGQLSLTHSKAALHSIIHEESLCRGARLRY